MNEKALATVDQDVFVAFDRLDDDQIIAEMKGAALQAYVYEFEQNGQKVRGLSKAGTDDASRIMATKYGEALREEAVHLEYQDEEAGYFIAKVVRVVVKNEGTEIMMDSAIGQKRQAKYVDTQKGRKINNFWFEQGGQKALRNAKQKLIPETIKQAIIQGYIDQGKIKRVTRQEVAVEQPSPDPIREHIATLSPTTAKLAPAVGQGPKEPAWICEECTQHIETAVIEGKSLSAEKIGSTTQKRTGRILCLACYEKTKATTGESRGE